MINATSKATVLMVSSPSLHIPRICTLHAEPYLEANVTVITQVCLVCLITYSPSNVQHLCISYYCSVQILGM